MTAPYAHIGVMGAGAWGTALAQTVAMAGRKVTLYCRRKEQAVGITSRGENAERLTGIALSSNVSATHDIARLAECDAVLCAAPAQETRSILTNYAPLAEQTVPVVLCAKGFEAGSTKLLTTVLGETAPRAIPAVLTGPGFADEVAQGLPTALTLACAHPEASVALAEAIAHPTFRPYLTDDLIGAQVGGAVKNVIAIACGVVRGRRMGKGAEAALITRGHAEMTRLAVALGASADTLRGLCGIGDLMLTCSSMTSRNMSLGHALGLGQRLEEILAERTSVTEGVRSAGAIVGSAKGLGVDVPICAAVDQVLQERASIDDVIGGLLARPLKAEMV